jgi:glycosyltransferase involved in cell wall biosynthesis
MKLISFVVPCYNSAAYMDIAIQSLLKGGEEVEIIIVDDGSKDNTGSIADSYLSKYPTIVKVVHQPNGGHGEGINQGIKAATGVYFKVVDSDDWVDEETYKILLDKIRKNENLPDLFVCGYDYNFGRGNVVRRIRYSNVFPTEKTIGWNKVRHFLNSQYLTLHSCMYKTSVVKESKVVLPTHTFYEDNYFIYTVMPFAKTIQYVDRVFYCYLVGRVGQSVSKDVGVKRYMDHLKNARLVFDQYDIFKIAKENKQLGRTLYHHCRLIFALGVIFTTLNGSPEANRDLEEFFAHCKEKNPHLAKRFMRYAMTAPLCWPKGLGKANVHTMYWFAHHVVKFN